MNVQFVFDYGYSLRNPVLSKSLPQTPTNAADRQQTIFVNLWLVRDLMDMSPQRTQVSYSWQISPRSTVYLLRICDETTTDFWVCGRLWRSPLQARLSLQENQTVWIRSDPLRNRVRPFNSPVVISVTHLNYKHQNSPQKPENLSCHLVKTISLIILSNRNRNRNNFHRATYIHNGIKYQVELLGLWRIN